MERNGGAVDWIDRGAFPPFPPFLDMFKTQKLGKYLYFTIYSQICPQIPHLAERETCIERI